MRVQLPRDATGLIYVFFASSLPTEQLSIAFCTPDGLALEYSGHSCSPLGIRKSRIPSAPHPARSRGSGTWIPRTGPGTWIRLSKCGSRLTKEIAHALKRMDGVGRKEDQFPKVSEDQKGELHVTM